jgi:uncharacterized protein
MRLNHLARIGITTLVCALAPMSTFAADARLADAVMRGDKEAVRTLMSDAAGINAAQVDGTTALHWAVRQNDAATTDLLIKAKADVNASNRYGLTPIYLAATNGNAAIIEKLLNAGVKANTATPAGETALMTVSRTGNLDAVKLLLDRGADVNAKESVRGQTALMWAVLEDHKDVVKLLLSRKADINAQTTTRIPPGEYVPARAGGASGNGIIRQRALPTADGGMTPLLFAIREANIEMTRLLLDSGADINLASANQTSPLMIAILNGQVGIATYLLERGADVNALDAYHRGALFATIELRNFNHDKYPDLPTDGKDPMPLMRALLAKGANPNVQTNTTPVHGLMQFDGSWVNFDGQTPFLRAALSGDIEVMRLLLEYKADPIKATNEGTTPLMAAAGINWIPGQTFSYSESSFVEAVKLCLERGADVNAQNSLGFTAMHGAANRGWESIIQVLADHGAKLDVKDKQGRTPMTFAEGIFLAIRPPEAKPKAMALLKKLMSEGGPAVAKQ